MEISMLKKSNSSLKSYNEKLLSELDETKEKLFHVENILKSIQTNKASLIPEIKTAEDSEIGSQEIQNEIDNQSDN